MKPATSTLPPATRTMASSPVIGPSPPRRRSRWLRRIVVLALLGAAGAAAYWYREPAARWLHYATDDGGKAATVPLYTLHRGVLRCAIVEEGRLHGLHNNIVMLEVNGKITWLAQAGAKVKKGDLLVTVDKKMYEDQRLTAAGELETARQTLVIAQQAIPIAESTSQAEVAAAKTKRDQAALDLKMYTTVEVPKKLNEFETQLNDIRGKLQDAQKKHADAQAQLDEHLEDDDGKKSLQQQLDLSKQTTDSFQTTLKNLDNQRRLFRAYSYPQDLRSKNQALANAELEVVKSETAAKSDLIQKQAEVRKAKELIDRLTRNIAQLDDSMAKCAVHAPVDGLVFYGSPEMEAYAYMQDQIRVGVDWYRNSPVMTIPDLSSFKVDVGIPEIYRGRLALGQAGNITLEAVPGLSLTGSITKLSSVARNRIPWDMASPQVFDSSITVRENDPRMVAGMTARVEITTAIYQNVLFVPVEGVFGDEGRTVVYLQHAHGQPEKWPVKTGESNDNFVVIAAGLEEGDQILLSQPESFHTGADYLARAAAVESAALPTSVLPPSTLPAESQPATAPGTGPATAPGSQPATGPGSQPATEPATTQPGSTTDESAP